MFKRILIDTNGIKLHDYKTGISRTVNNIVKNLIYNNKDIEIIPFYILNNKAYVNKNLLDVFDKNNNFTHNQQIILNRNDYILIADFIAPIWENCFVFYKQAKNLDIYISVINYDFIPVKYPEFVPNNLNFDFSKKFKQYVDIFFFNIVNEIICISKTVAFETEEYCKSFKKIYSFFPKISYWYLGFDFEKQISEDKNIKFFNNFYNKEYLLMVGTVEPRKNNKLAIETMTQLWNKNYNLFLIIIGKNGWRSDELIEEIRNHKEYNKKLFYFDRIEDYELTLFYKHAKAILQLSIAEGFGLPLWEASQYGTEIICSDIPVLEKSLANMQIMFL
jgi:glycosyltransferase involved in cell wall biosynthesis